MSNERYEFDPATLDGSDKDEISIDTWKPTSKKPMIVQSNWRQQQIGENYNQEPGIDELRKIHAYIKKKCSDAEIMNAFGINAETMLAIKKNQYDPVDGIALSNQSKIYNEFARLENLIKTLQRGLTYLADALFINPVHMDNYKKACKKPKTNSKIKKDNGLDEMPE